jgi:LysR family cys regulon transcriptional activator
MKLQQLRYLVEVERQNLNVSAAADALATSQPGVSKQIRLLEDELGVTIFERSGKRLVHITAPGRIVLDIANRILRETQNLTRVGQDFTSENDGTLSIATTHTQARYTLPTVIQRFLQLHPAIRLHLQQGSPAQIAQWLLDGVADLGIATEALDQHAELLTLPCYQWSHLVIAPKGHPLITQGAPTLATLATYPLITYDLTFTGRSHIDRAFERQGLQPNVMLTAIDSDVIKTYVSLGLGLGIIAEMAFDPLRDDTLAALPASHLFEANTTRLGFRRDAWLRVSSLRELLGIISAYEWRRNGVEVPALGARIHPHYGVFSPVRGEYVDLVAKAPLPAAQKTDATAFDIGTGTGVLAAVLAKRGFTKVIATDQDPRALACARENVERLGLQAQIDVVSTDLFPPGRAPLVVCNPPWLPARPPRRWNTRCMTRTAAWCAAFWPGWRITCRRAAKAGSSCPISPNISACARATRCSGGSACG